MTVIRAHFALLSTLLLTSIVVAGVACDGNGGEGEGEGTDGGIVVIQFDAGPLPDPADGGVLDAGPVNTVVTVTSLTPPTGGITGGNRPILEGANFDPGCVITFGGVEATNCLFLTTTRMSCEAPPTPAPGPVDVRAVCAQGVGELVAGYFYFSPITVTDIDPATGSTTGGTSVVVTGTDLNADMIVLVGGRQLVDLVVDADGLHARGRTPPRDVPGRTDVVGIDAYGRSTLALAFTYVADLELDAVEPGVVLADDQGNAVVELGGHGFTERDGVDTVADVSDVTAPTNNLINDERLRVVVPVVGAGAHDVSVARGSVEASLSGALVVLGAATGTFAVNAVAPNAVGLGGGEVVTVGGEGFSTASAVTLGGAGAVFHVIDDRRLSVTVPAHAAGVVDVVVTRADSSSAVLDDGLTFRTPLSVTGVVPANGPAAGGDTITVNGAGFVTGVSVDIGGIACADVVVVSPTSLTCTAPAGAAGNVDVVVRAPDGSRAAGDVAFLFEQAPRVLGLKPARGGMSGDVFVTITGAGFETAKRLAQAQNSPTTVVNVSFSGAFADPREVTVVNDNTLTLRTPFAIPGLLDVTVVVCDVNAAESQVQRQLVCDTVVGPAVDDDNDPATPPISPPLWSATAESAYTVFDPTSILGGTRGGPIDGAMYLTAFDAQTGFPIPNLVVFAGSVGESGGQPVAVDITNQFGQATLSGPEIVGAQTITVAGDGFEYSTLVDVNAAEVSLYLMNIGGGGEGEGEPPPQPEPAQIRGRVFGFAKEFFDPAALGPDELAIAFVETTGRDEFSGGSQADSAVIGEGGEFHFSFSRPGRLALVAVAGIFNTTTKEFRPLQMGVRREVFPEFGVTLVDQDIELTIALDREVDLSLPDAPLDFEIEDITARFGNGPDITRVIPFIQLGGEGAFNYTNAVGGTRNHALSSMPDVPGEMLTFIAGSYSTTGFNLFTNFGTVTLRQNSVVVAGAGVSWNAVNGNGTPAAIGQILVVNLPNGTRFASTIVGLDPITNELRVLDRSPVNASGLTFHIGSAGIPSSEVIQDGVGDLRGGVTIQPVLGIPEVISPIDNGVLLQRTLRWKRALGEQPTIHQMFLFEPINLAQVWSFYIDGSRTKVPVPVVPRFEDFAPLLPRHELDFLVEDFVPPGDLIVGQLAWQHEAIFTPGLEYTNWSLLDIGTRGRRAWTTNLKIFVHGRDD